MKYCPSVPERAAQSEFLFASAVAETRKSSFEEVGKQSVSTQCHYLNRPVPPLFRESIFSLDDKRRILFGCLFGIVLFRLRGNSGGRICAAKFPDILLFREIILLRLSGGRS